MEKRAVFICSGAAVCYSTLIIDTYNHPYIRVIIYIRYILRNDLNSICIKGIC